MSFSRRITLAGLILPVHISTLGSRWGRFGDRRLQALRRGGGGGYVCDQGATLRPAPCVLQFEGRKRIAARRTPHLLSCTETTQEGFMTVYTGTTFQTCALRIWGVWVSMRDFQAATVTSWDLPPAVCFYKSDVGMARCSASVYQPSNTRLYPYHGVLTRTIQKKNNEYKRGRDHKQDRENHQGGDHFLDVIEAYRRHRREADPNPLVPACPDQLL